jgi:sorting nexin-29
VLGEEKVILDRWAEHFSDLLNKNIVSGNEQLNPPNLSNGQIVENLMKPTRQEVEAINKMKNNRAPGEGVIVAEMIKYGGEGLKNAIHKLLQRIWEEENMPESWKMGVICPIFKKGDKLACENYRGITLLNVVYKVLSSVMNERMKRYSEDLLEEYQCGFRLQRSTTDQIFIIRQVMEKFYEHECDLYMLFIDFRQAFDSIRREELYTALKEMKIPGKLIILVQLII